MEATDEQWNVVPKMRDDIDIMKAGLSVEEGFIASRVDGRTPLVDIARMVGKTPKETHRLLQRLAKAGVVRLGDEGETERPQRPKPEALEADTGYGSYIFPPHLMMVEADLNESERKRIIYFFEHLTHWTHYELLQAKRKDDVKTIKRAYFLRSKEWHPDRFRRPNLGPFKSMIDRIFQQVQTGYRALSNPVQRKEYDAANVLMIDEDEIADMLKKQRKKDRDIRRVQRDEDRRKRRNPMHQRIDKAKKFYQEALDLQAAGSSMEALRVAQLAVTFDVRSEYEALVNTLNSEAVETRIQPLMRRGQSQESLTNWDFAIDAFKEAVRLAPENPKARLRLAFNLIMAGRPDDASPHGQKAVQMLPNEPEAHFVLGLCYEKAGMEKAAIRALAKAVELKPNYSDAKKRLRSLKWGF